MNNKEEQYEEEQDEVNTSCYADEHPYLHTFFWVFINILWCATAVFIVYITTTVRK